MKDTDKAIAAYQKAIEINPKYASAWRSLGNYDKAVECHQKSVEFEKALECFMKSIELDSENAWSWAYVGLILSRNDLLNEALQAYDKALEPTPDNKVIKDSREKLLAKMK